MAKTDSTAVPHHVLVSTTYSKSVLRVVCEDLSSDNPDICYFPSYEIIIGNHARGAYFGEDCRSVTATGVDHVMRLFFKHFAGIEKPDVPMPADNHAPEDKHTAEMAELVQANCDEEALDRE